MQGVGVPDGEGKIACLSGRRVRRSKATGRYSYVGTRKDGFQASGGLVGREGLRRVRRQLRASVNRLATFHTWQLSE